MRAEHDPRLVIRTAFQSGTFVISLYGEIDADTVGDLDRALRRAEATDASEIVIDLSGLDFIDSAGINALVTADARSRADSSRLSLLRGSGQVERVIELCGLTDRLPFAD